MGEGTLGCPRVASARAGQRAAGARVESERVESERVESGGAWIPPNKGKCPGVWSVLVGGTRPGCWSLATPSTGKERACQSHSTQTGIVCVHVCV